MGKWYKLYESRRYFVKVWLLYEQSSGLNILGCSFLMHQRFCSKIYSLKIWRVITCVMYYGRNLAHGHNMYYFERSNIIFYAKVLKLTWEVVKKCITSHRLYGMSHIFRQKRINIFKIWDKQTHTHSCSSRRHAYEPLKYNKVTVW